MNTKDDFINKLSEEYIRGQWERSAHHTPFHRAHADAQRTHAEWAIRNPGKNAGGEVARCAFWGALGFLIGS